MSIIELNMRLDVRGRASTAAEIEQRHSRALELLGAVEHRRYDREVDGVRVPCLVAAVQGWTAAQVYDLAVQLDQDCIAALDAATGHGSLIGPRVEGYGTFDLAHFQRLNVAPITPAPVDPAKGNALLKKLFGSKLPIVQDPEQSS